MCLPSSYLFRNIEIFVCCFAHPVEACACPVSWLVERLAPFVHLTQGCMSRGRHAVAVVLSEVLSTLALPKDASAAAADMSARLEGAVTLGHDMLALHAMVSVVAIFRKVNIVKRNNYAGSEKIQRVDTGQKPKHTSFCMKGATTHTSLHQIGPNLASN